MNNRVSFGLSSVFIYLSYRFSIGFFMVYLLIGSTYFKKGVPSRLRDGFMMVAVVGYWFSVSALWANSGHLPSFY